MSKGHALLFVVIGAVLWFLAAMLIRFFPSLFAGDGTTAILFFVSVPATWLLIYLLMTITGLAREHVFSATCVGVVTAMFLDGFAITWAPRIYGGASDHLASGAAWLLYGVAVFMCCAALIGRRKTA